jgi:hypothetical protein
MRRGRKQGSAKQYRRQSSGSGEQEFHFRKHAMRVALLLSAKQLSFVCSR